MTYTVTKDDVKLVEMDNDLYDRLFAQLTSNPKDKDNVINVLLNFIPPDFVDVIQGP